MNTLLPYLAKLAPEGRPSWLDSQRHAALTAFLRRGLPTTREEGWKYTALDYLGTAPLRVPGGDAGRISGCGGDYPGAVLEFSDGKLAARHGSRLGPTSAGSLAEALDSPLVRKYFAGLAGTAALTGLNAALWRDGAVLHVPRDIRLSDPLFLVFRTAEAGVMVHPRNLVVLEEGAEALLVEDYPGSTGDPYWHNAVTEIVLKAGARLTHLKLTDEGPGATHTALTLVQQERGSHYRGLNVSIGGRLARHDLSVRLQGEGAEARLDGLLIAAGRAHVDTHLGIEHLAPHAVSRTTYRGIAGGRGRGVFDGRVTVHGGGRHADAQLSSRNLLLSPYAEIDAKPQLEIYADEVQCGHGVTVGQLDEAQLFYLRSRGIPHRDAYTLLLKAFADAALGMLDECGMRAWLEARLIDRLPVPTGPNPGD